MSAEERRRRWVAAGAHRRWPSWSPSAPGRVLMRIIHARGERRRRSRRLQDWPARARVAYDGMAPYLHVIVLAAPLAVVGGLVLSRVRRRSGVANDWWAWAGLACGLLAVGGAYVTGTADLRVWLVGTVDRVTEFSALAGWWIVAMWAVVASGGSAPPRTGRSPGRLGRPAPEVDPPGRPRPLAVAVAAE